MGIRSRDCGVRIQRGAGDSWTFRPGLNIWQVSNGCDTGFGARLALAAEREASIFRKGCERVSKIIQLDDDHFHDHCGVFGIFGHPEAAKMSYLGLYALQHRGQESAGIASTDGTQVHAHKSLGLVQEIFTPEVIARLPGDASIGHTRYSTAGDNTLMNAQPVVIDCNKGKIALGHNGNLTNAIELRKKLEHRESIFQTTSDTEVIVHLIARSQARNLTGAIADALNQVEGAYSLLLLTRDEIFAIRDPRGFRPLNLGRLDGAWVVASETCAFDLIDAEYVREVEPGEMVRISRSGVESIRFAAEKPHQYCIFEHVYFSRPDSVVFGRPVNQSRERLGRLLAREHGVEADLVTPVPDSGTPAAIGYAAESGIPFRMALIRNHYIGRTFIEPVQAIRDFGVKLKLNAVRSLLEGKRVILVDDSIVRGTTSKKIVRMIRNAGAKEVHMRISCPPTISPCFYGVDTPSKKELIAANKTTAEIRDFIVADSLAYLSIEGLKKACGDGEKTTYCSACYTGKYPTKVDVEEILPAGASR